MKTIHKGTNKKFKCKIGLHKWRRRSYSIASSNVIDKEKVCKRCGKIKRKTILK